MTAIIARSFDIQAVDSDKIDTGCRHYVDRMAAPIINLLITLKMVVYDK